MQRDEVLAELTESERDAWEENDRAARGPMYSGRADAFGYREALTEVARLRRALKGVAHSPHCSYENGEQGMYGIGVTDGHRCAAKVARLALGETVED